MKDSLAVSTRPKLISILKHRYCRVFVILILTKQISGEDLRSNVLKFAVHAIGND